MTLSSAEAEYYALTGAASEALGLQEATRFLTGELVELKAFTDSSSARAIAARQGVGKIKHLATRMLWLQQAQKEGRLSVHSVPTARNPADIATKPLASKRILLLMYYLRFFNNGRRVGEEQHQEAQSKELVRRVSKAITKNNNMMQMFHVILASALQIQSEAAADSHDREEVPQGISIQMNNTLLPQEAMDWRWNFQMVCGFALGVFTTMAIVYYYKRKKEKRSDDEALDEVQESLDTYLEGALRVQRYQRGVLLRSKVGELLTENSFLRARRKQGEKDLDRVHNKVEELQVENENLKKEIQKLKELIPEDESLDEDLAEEEEKEEDPEVQAEAKEKPEESTTDDEMPTMIPAEGDPPVVNEEAMERRKQELREMKEKAKKRREGKREGTEVWGEVLHVPTEPSSASYQHPPEVQQQREEGGKKGNPTGKGEGNKEGEVDMTNKSLHQLQAENYNDDAVLFTDIGIIWKFFRSSSTYQAFKDDRKGGMYYTQAPIKGKGERMDQTNRYRHKGRWLGNDRDKERQEKGKTGKGTSQEEQQQDSQQQQQGDKGSYKGSNKEEKGQKGHSGEGKGGKNYHDYQTYQKGKGKGKPWWGTHNVKGWAPKPTSGKATHCGKKGQWFSDGEFYPFDSCDPIYQWNANAGYSHSWYNDQGYVDENEYQLYTGQQEDDNSSGGQY